MLCFTGGRNKAQIVAKITAEKETANQKGRSFLALSRNNTWRDFRLLLHLFEVFTLLGCYVVQVNSWLLTFLDHLLVPSSRVKQSKKTV
jgi:hypothetical protein